MIARSSCTIHPFVALPVSYNLPVFAQVREDLEYFYSRLIDRETVNLMAEVIANVELVDDCRDARQLLNACSSIIQRFFDVRDGE
jgi:hypothetical protein